MALSHYPLLFQVNTRVWLTELSRTLRRPATLDDIPDADLDRLAEMGFDWVWFLSVWQTGPAGQGVSRSHPEWRKEFKETLSDLREEDIPGSGFAITGYTVHRALGGEGALARLRERLRRRGLRLMLDFVPNHTGLDHPWVEDHPEYYISGTDPDLARAPGNYTWARRKRGDLVLAYGHWRLQDLLSDTHYDREGSDLQSRGLYLDVPSWHYHVFEVKAHTSPGEKS
jgi:glycosidase